MSSKVQSRDDLRLMRVDQVLEVVPVSRATLYRMIRKGEFPKPCRIGRLTVWPHSDVRAWVNRVKWNRVDEIEEDLI